MTLTLEEIKLLPVYEASTPGVWYVDNDDAFPAAWAEFHFDGLSEIGLDVEFTQTYDENNKRQRTATVVQMSSDRGTLVYHSWLTSSEFLFVWRMITERNIFEDDHRSLPEEMRSLLTNGSIKKYGFSVFGE